MLSRPEAIKIIEKNRPKCCKMVNGNLQGGFSDHESEFGQALDLAIEVLSQPQSSPGIPCNEAVDIGYLYDWYISSVMNDEPVWTEAHIEELCNDFIIIPKPLQEIHKGE